MSKTTNRAATVERRTIHLLDIENLHGGTDLTGDDARRIWQVYSGYALNIARGDQVVVASSSYVAKTVWFALPQNIRRLVRDGRDGADLALMDDLDLPHASSRFSRLVIASGDGGFTSTALAARAAGLSVHQVIGRGQPARALMVACPTRSWLHLGEGSGLRTYRAHSWGRSSVDLTA